MTISAKDLLWGQNQTQQSLVGDPASPAPAAGDWFGKWRDRLFGEVDPTTGNMKTVGVAAPILQGLAGLGSAWMGMKQYGLAKDALKFQKKAFNQEFAMNKNLVNSEMSDRQRARVASNPGAYQSEADYMKQWSVK